jgi:hypothetical protein
LAWLELEARQTKPHLERGERSVRDLTRQGSVGSGDGCETDRVREVREPLQGRHKYISREEEHAKALVRWALLCEDGV